MRILVVALGLLGLLLVWSGPALAQNPFVNGSKGSSGQVEEVPQETSAAHENSAPGLTQRFTAGFMDRIMETQRNLHKRLSAMIRDYQEHGAGPGRILVLLGLSFAYGLVHALGPGHGKSVASAYFVSRGGTVRQGLLMGFATAATHALSAVVVVLGVYLLLRNSLSTGFEGAANRVTQVSFACVGVLGLAMLAHSLREAVRGPHSETAAASGPPVHYLKVALVSGLIPCPGAAVILFFTLALGVPVPGILAVAAMSLGMGVTVGAAAAATVCCRSAVRRASSSRPRLWRVLRSGLAVTGSLAVFLLGALLFASSLRW